MSSDYTVRLRRGAWLASVSLSTVILAVSSAQADTAAPQTANANSPIEEITVTGTYAGSLQKANEVKRRAGQVMDLIKAEDLGKFPTQNIGEALQRIPGITLDRASTGSSTSRGEAIHINLRGLPPIFQNVQFNGRYIAVNETVENGGKDGRAFRFDVLPSDLISSVEVIKTPSGFNEAGGIAGNINLKSYRPLDVGTKFAASAKGNYGELAESLDGAFSGLASWANEGKTFGALVSAGYTQRHARQDRVYHPGGWLRNRDLNLFPAGDVYEPTRSRPTIETEDRERFSFAGSVQYRPNDNMETNFDLLWTRLNNFYKEYGIDVFLNAGRLRPGSYVVDSSNTAIKGTMDGVQLQLSNETSLSRHDLWSIGGNQTWTQGDWKVVGDINYSRADSDTIQPIQRARFIYNNASVAYDFSRGYQSAPILTPSIDVRDPSFWTSVVGSVQARPQQAYDTDFETRFDVSRDFAGFISKIGTGINYQKREHDYWRIDRNSPTFAGVSPTIAGPGSVNQLPFNNFGSNFGSGYIKNWLDPNNAYLFAKYFDPALLTTPSTAADLATQSHLKEDIYEYYVAANFGTKLGSIPVSGNVGVRVAQTQQLSTGYAFSAGVSTPVAYKKDYTDPLPSFNIQASLRDDLIVRVGISKALSRPDLGTVAPGLVLATDTPTASGGNPNIDPFRSTNFDVSVEWYFNSFGRLAVAGFQKDFESYITTATTSLTIPGSKFGTYLLTSTANGGNAKLSGLEMSYQQKFDFLPKPFDGFGAEASYTRVSQKSSFTNGVRTVRDSIIGVSPSSYSLVGFYENGPFASRIGYFWRDKYLIGIGATTGTDGYFDEFGSLDASVNYNVTDRLTLSIEATNLMDKAVYTYATIKSRPQEIFYAGRTVSFGARYQF